MSRLSRRPSGTSPSTMRRARPSTMAVLPTPGSPMSTGLFLVRRDSTWMTRRISSSRPMTGSSLPLRASSVRSRPYFSSAWYCSSGFSLVTRWLPRTSLSASSTASWVTPSAAEQVADAAGDLAHREQQVLGREVVVAERRRARRRRPRARGTRRPTSWASLGRLRRRPSAARPSASSTRSRSASAATPMRSSTGSTTLSGWPTRAAQQVLGRDLRVVLLARQRPGRRRGPRRSCGCSLFGVERHALYLGVDGTVPKVDNDAVNFIPASDPGVSGRGTRSHDGPAAPARGRGGSCGARRSTAASSVVARPGPAPPRARRPGRGASSSSASSSRIRRTPARLTPSLVSSWMRWSSAMSRSE